MIFDWLSQDERYKIHDAHLAQFKDLYERTGLVEDHPAVGDFPFIKGSHLLTCPRLPEYRDVRAKLKPLSQIQAERHFVSHRWLSPSHPDPDGKLLRVLKEHVDPDVYYWIDFSCLPQKPRTEREETLFRAQRSRTSRASRARKRTAFDPPSRRGERLRSCHTHAHEPP